MAICLVSSHFWVGNNFSKSMDSADRNGSICSMFTVTVMLPLLSRESIWVCLPSKVGCQPTKLFIFRVFSAKFSGGANRYEPSPSVMHSLPGSPGHPKSQTCCAHLASVSSSRVVKRHRRPSPNARRDFFPRAINTFQTHFQIHFL